MTFETLPDDVLLEIFACYLYLDRSEEINVWHMLVHVCQRWRYPVFASPGHLNLRLECTTETRAREMLGVWPPFPIVISGESGYMTGVDNIVAALEQRDRVREIKLEHIPDSKMDAFVPAMLGPFPALDGIIFGTDDKGMGVVPDLFLGGSAPQLQWLSFHAIPFPALPTLLSSTINLDCLELSGIPRSGYISSEEMVTCLSAMPNLDDLRFQFDSPQSFPNGESRPHPPMARCTLPALRELIFEGVNEYFEGLVARIDTPVIRKLEITFFHRHFYDFSQLSQFIGRVGVFKSPAHANIGLYNFQAEVSVSFGTGTDEPASLSLGISCNELHLQLLLATLLQPGKPRYLQCGSITERTHRGRLPMVGPFTPIFRCEGSEHRQEQSDSCRVYVERGRQGKDNRYTSCDTRTFHRGALAIEVYPEGG